MELRKAVPFLVSQTGWSLEYIYDLPIRILLGLVAELEWQKANDDYARAQLFGMVICNWANANSKGRRYRIQDFIGEPPKRKEEERIMTIEDKPNTVELADGKTYILPVITLNVMVEVEDKLGKPFSKLFQDGEAKSLRCLLWVLLRKNNPNLSEDEVGNLITTKVMNGLVTKITEQMKE